MEVWNTFRRQIVALWMKWSVSQRIAISLGALACVAAVVGTLIWAAQPEYVLLAENLSLQEALDIKGLLETEQIDCELSFSGRAVSVPRADVSRARLAIQEILEPSVSPATGTSTLIPGSEAAEREQRLRSLELRIARTIERLHGIRSATVHISRPDPSPFVMEQAPPTAGVVLDTSQRSRITAATAQSIILIVARAVEGLDPANVHLTDTEGRRFAAADGIGSDMDSQLEYRRRLELNLTHKAESLLADVLGEGRARVQVTADVDFREISRTTKTVDPETKTKLEETLESVKSEGTGGTVGGLTGTAPNVEAVSGPLSGGSGGTYKSESTMTRYDHASSSETIRVTPGEIRRLTVAVVADLSVPEDSESAAPPLTEEAVEDIVRQAVGFDAARGDTISVVSAPISPPEPVEEPPGLLPLYEQYRQYRPLAEAVLVGLGATMAFLIAVLSLRRLRPVLVQDESSLGFTREDYERMAQLSLKARENPELAARIVATWLGQDADVTSPEREVRRPSRAA